MAIGLLLIGSLMGVAGATMAAMVGQSLMTVIGLYFGTSLVSIACVIGVCATRHGIAALQRARQAHSGFIGNAE